MALRIFSGSGLQAFFARGDKLASGEYFPLIPYSDNDPQRWTYTYAGVGLVLPANATDILQIQGANGYRTVLRQIICSGTATAAQNLSLQLVHRSAASTGGTPSTPGWHKRDSGDPNAVTGLTVFAGVPAVGATLGGNSGISEAGRLNVAPANNGAVDRWINQYSWQNEKGIVLNSASEYLSLFIPGGNLNVANAPVLDVSLIITEEKM